MRHLILLLEDAATTAVPDTGTWEWRAAGHGPSGGAQKAAFRDAIDQGFDAVTVVQPQTRVTTDVLRRIDHALRDDPSLGFLSCLGTSIGRRCLAALSRWVSGQACPAWQSPCVTYRTAALRKTAYELNNDRTVFEVEIALQLLDQGITAGALAAPALSGGPRSGAWGVLKACLKFRLQKINLFYDFRYHPAALGESPYVEKRGARGPHAWVCTDPTLIPAGARVLDLGCATGYIANRLVETKQCAVVGVDQLPPERVDAARFVYRRMDLETETDRVCALLSEDAFDVVLMLDVLEHLARPEIFLWKLYRAPMKRSPLFIFSTGNVAFWVIRLMLLLGYFNYGEKGILDISHKRLFSWRTFQNLFDQTGFTIEQKRCFPPPYAFLGFPPLLCRILERIDSALIRLRPSLFAYQVLFVARSGSPASRSNAAARS